MRRQDLTDPQRITLDWLAEVSDEEGRFVNGYQRTPARFLCGKGLAEPVGTTPAALHRYRITEAGRALARAPSKGHVKGLPCPERSGG